MFEITGKYNTAVCYAEIADETAVAQITRMLNHEFTAGSRIRIMPDVHAGKGCTIGTTMTITDKAVPNIVGVDIGCGMYTLSLGQGDIDLAAVDRAAHIIPSGRSVWDEEKEPFPLADLRCAGSLKELGWLRRSLGTLGGGNHFIEIDAAEDGTHYLVIHSGSRNLGKQVAEIYQQMAVDQHRGRAEYLQQQEEAIRTLKETGNEKQIEKTLRQLDEAWRHKQADMPEDLCWLGGQVFEDYLHDIEICQAFARRSREYMAEFIVRYCGLTAGEGFHTIHNYIDTQERVLRKGAISAHKGEKILIPLNMRDGCILAIGKGNPEWNESAPHGAGRLMSRAEARNTLDMHTYEDAMTGIYTTSVNRATLDEAPMAYKPKEAIIRALAETADIQEILKPVYNFKAAE